MRDKSLPIEMSWNNVRHSCDVNSLSRLIQPPICVIACQNREEEKTPTGSLSWPQANVQASRVQKKCEKLKRRKRVRKATPITELLPKIQSVWPWSLILLLSYFIAVLRWSLLWVLNANLYSVIWRSTSCQYLFRDQWNPGSFLHGSVASANKAKIDQTQSNWSIMNDRLCENDKNSKSRGWFV